jgi:hypothetical protein
LLCGGLAVALYGIPRMTFDIDLLLDFSSENLAKFEAAMYELGYKEVLPLRLNSVADESTRANFISKNNLIAFSFFNHKEASMNVDVLIDCPIPFLEMKTRKNEREIGDVRFSIISVEDLIALKKHANREQDKRDIEELIKFKSSPNESSI